MNFIDIYNRIVNNKSHVLKFVKKYEIQDEEPSKFDENQIKSNRLNVDFNQENNQNYNTLIGQITNYKKIVDSFTNLGPSNENPIDYQNQLSLSNYISQILFSHQNQAIVNSILSLMKNQNENKY